MNLTPLKGTYIILLKNSEKQTFSMGSLGIRDFYPGYYLYCGSAFGPGGIRARVGRHLKTHKKKRWHIDHLREKTQLMEVWISCSKTKLECVWADHLDSMKTSYAVLNAGSSDCSCSSHLFRFSRKPSFRYFRIRTRQKDLTQLHVSS